MANISTLATGTCSMIHGARLPQRALEKSRETRISLSWRLRSGCFEGKEGATGAAQLLYLLRGRDVRQHDTDGVDDLKRGERPDAHSVLDRIDVAAAAHADDDEKPAVCTQER